MSYQIERHKSFKQTVAGLETAVKSHSFGALTPMLDQSTPQWATL